VSKITGYWKRHLRPLFFNAVRRFGGVPVPRESTTAADYEDRSRACVVTELPHAHEAIPPRLVVGHVDELENTKALIPDPLAYARYERGLLGADLHRSDECVAVIDGGRVTHDAGVVITPDSCIVADVSGLAADSDLPTNPLRLRFLAPPRRRTGSVAIVTCTMPYNYYHWLIEALPRLALYERAGIRADRFYAPVDDKFQRQSLRLLGIDPGRVEPATANRHVVADTLVASSLRRDATRWKTDFLHHRLTRGLDAASAPSLRVFVSRRHRGKRTLTNDDAVFRALKPLGFRRFDLESLSVAEQIRLFFDAACVVAPHGAGLTNIVFCRPGTKVVEINTPYRINVTCFYWIAHYRRLDYRLHVARPVRDRFFHFDPASAGGDSDLWVDPEEFAASVAAVLEAVPVRPAVVRRAA